MITSFSSASLRSTCEILADTQDGLKGSQIGRILSDIGVHDPEPTFSKRDRLCVALAERQKADGCGNLVGAFIEAAMKPVGYTKNADTFAERRNDLNRVLSFEGLELGEDGKLRSTTPAQTLTEAESRASQLRHQLVQREVHHEVLRFARAELLKDNYFHAVLEATKSVAERIRSLSNEVSDGSELIDACFGVSGGLPVLAFNSLRTETEKSEQRGLINLLKGMFGTFRNPTSHAPKISWPMDEADALDLLSLVSYLHRRLDRCVSTRQAVSATN